MYMRKFWAVLGVAVTVVIAVVGFSGYASGEYSMAWLGIELSQGGFFVLVLAFAVFDIFALKGAFGAEKAVEKMREEALERTRDAERLDDPCKVYLTRFSAAVGAAMGVRVFLNGVEQPVLKSGKTIEMTTELVKNELMVRYNADNVTRSIQFDAKPGGSVRITLKYAGAVLKLQEGERAPVGKPGRGGRYRPLKVGYILWSIPNLLVYFAGLVPLIMTIKAAKEPYEDAARARYKAVLIWNIVLSSLLAALVILMLIINR